MSPQGVVPAIGRPLHIRAALAALPLLLALGAAMLLMLQQYSAQTAREASQRMNLGLARYVVDHQASGLITADGGPDRLRMADLAHHVMMINPAVEVYLLDADGRVLAHALDGNDAPQLLGTQVDLVPVARLLGAAHDADEVRLPVLGTDPRTPDRVNTFSVARVPRPGALPGYLYIVLNGRQAQRVSQSLSNSDTLRTMAGFIALIVVAAAVVLWLT